MEFKEKNNMVFQIVGDFSWKGEEDSINIKPVILPPTSNLREHLARLGTGMGLVTAVALYLLVYSYERQSMMDSKTAPRFNDLNVISPFEAKPNKELQLSDAEYLRIAYQLLTERGLDMNKKSFVEIMAENGYMMAVQGFIPFEETQLFKAGIDRPWVRRLPAPDFWQEKLGQITMDKLNKDDLIKCYGLLPFIDVITDQMLIFGLTSWDEVRLSDDQLTDSPNRFGNRIIQPRWIFSNKIYLKSGKIENYVDTKQSNQHTQVLEWLVKKFTPRQWTYI